MRATKQGSAAEEPRYNVLVRMLLRHYAKNRRRSWRNGAHDAFYDATIQVEVPLTALVVTPLALANLILNRTLIPWLAQTAFDKITNGAAIVGLLSIAIVVAIDTSFKPYEFIPGIERQFDTKRDRNLVNLYFFGILGLMV